MSTFILHPVLLLYAHCSLMCPIAFGEQKVDKRANFEQYNMAFVTYITFYSVIIQNLHIWLPYI